MSEHLIHELKIALKENQGNAREQINAISGILDKWQSFKTVEELQGTFVIPSFQRGYRWKVQQVTDLLDDVQKFDPKKEKFYCLQPVIITKTNNENEFEVIDGQQRLTTIFLTLQCLTGKSPFRIKYETHPETTDVLESHVSQDDNQDDNIEVFHIKQARRTIEEWFRKKDEKFKSNWKDNFLKHTKVIWHEVDGTEDVRQTFMRINAGKIPLTNSELIRALFIHNAGQADTTSAEQPSIRNNVASVGLTEEEKLIKQHKIATEWDYIEQQLWNEDFWSFITLGETLKDGDYPNRIEFLFELEKGKPTGSDKYFTFFKYFEDQNNPEGQWNKIKQLYYRLHEWFTDETIYHLAGFVLYTGICNLSKLNSEASTRNKSDFRKYLLEQINKKFKNICDNAKLSKGEDILESLNYHDHRDQVQWILKLFNVYAHMTEKTRCPFAKYKSEPWSLEHIHAQHSEDLAEDEWYKWAKMEAAAIREEKGLESCAEELDKILGESYSFEERKKNFYEKFKEFFGETDVHTIDNLALIGTRTNSSLSNKIFPNKRAAILGFIKSGERYVPLATKNVFLKYYSTAVGHMYKWSDSDRERYEESIEKMINIFSSEEEFNKFIKVH